MSVAVVLTVVGRDRPGIVRAVAAAVADAGGNWVESSLSRLGGEFAGIVRAEVPPLRLRGLELALRTLAAEDIQVSVRTTGQPLRPGHRATLRLTSVDQPGIIAEMSEVLAGLKVSIETLETGVEPGSMTGAPLFTAHAALLLPQGVCPDDVREALETLAGDLMADVDFADAGPVGQGRVAEPV
jgi:glycine cleavage system regulatory protein